MQQSRLALASNKAYCKVLSTISNWFLLGFKQLWQCLQEELRGNDFHTKQAAEGHMSFGYSIILFWMEAVGCALIPQSSMEDINCCNHDFWNLVSKSFDDRLLHSRHSCDHICQATNSGVQPKGSPQHSPLVLAHRTSDKHLWPFAQFQDAV